jgi:hypothetical protein
VLECEFIKVVTKVAISSHFFATCFINRTKKGKEYKSWIKNIYLFAFSEYRREAPWLEDQANQENKKKEGVSDYCMHNNRRQIK